MGRDPSPAPSTSTLSTIEVRQDEENTRVSSIAASASLTPATSLGDTASESDATKNTNRRRSGRARADVASYNDSILTGTAVHTRKSFRKEYEGGSRSVSEATLVDENTAEFAEKLSKYKTKAAGSDSTLNSDAKSVKTESSSPRKSTRVSRFETAASDAVGALFSTVSALGKRSRRALEDAKDSIQEVVADRRKSLRISNSKEQAEESEPTAKRTRLFPNLELAPPPEQEKKKPAGNVMRRKKFVTEGLYFGHTHPRQLENTKGKNSQQNDDNDFQGNSLFQPPMFFMERLLEHGRHYRLPYHVLNPLPNDQAPKDWHRLNKNRFIGDAAATWKKTHAKLPASTCVCSPDEGCREDCLNRTMQYECNNSNCNVGEKYCKNRAFAELKWRSKSKCFSRRPEKPESMSDQDYEVLRKEMGFGAESNLWGEGVEVIKTKDRGYGVRSMRTFTPGQIIVEYCGEIITPEEADRRMNEEYKDKNDFYLMTFHDRLIIDATRGSICRFVNHSCEPNCRVEKWTVDGEPRMALFAGDDGIMVGEELTYDYNFDPFSEKNIQTCRCGSDNCRGVLGPKPNKDSSKASKPISTTANVVKGIKRKLKHVFGDDEENDENNNAYRPKRKKVLPDAKALLRKATKQLTNLAQKPSNKTFNVLDEAQNKSRAERAARRSSSAATLRSQTDIKLSKRHSTSSVTVPTTKTGSHHTESHSLSLTRLASTNKPTKVLQNVLSSIKDRSSKALQSSISKTNRKRLPDGKSSSESTSSLLPENRLRQSKLSLGHGNLSFEDPDLMQVDGDTNKSEDEDLIAELEVSEPKTGARIVRSVAASVRSSAVRSIKGPQRAAAIVRMGLKGNEAVRKTIRQVSGAEE